MSGAMEVVLADARKRRMLGKKVSDIKRLAMAVDEVWCEEELRHIPGDPVGSVTLFYCQFCEEKGNEEDFLHKSTCPVVVAREVLGLDPTDE